MRACEACRLREALEDERLCKRCRYTFGSHEAELQASEIEARAVMAAVEDRLISFIAPIADDLPDGFLRRLLEDVDRIEAERIRLGVGPTTLGGDPWGPDGSACLRCRAVLETPRYWESKPDGGYTYHARFTCEGCVAEAVLAEPWQHWHGPDRD